MYLVLSQPVVESSVHSSWLLHRVGSIEETADSKLRQLMRSVQGARPRTISLSSVGHKPVLGIVKRRGWTACDSLVCFFSNDGFARGVCSSRNPDVEHIYKCIFVYKYRRMILPPLNTGVIPSGMRAESREALRANVTGFKAFNGQPFFPSSSVHWGFLCDARRHPSATCVVFAAQFLSDESPFEGRR